MREENFGYLANQVKYSGFGEEPASEIRKQMESGVEAFYVNVKGKVAEDFTDATLHFSKSKMDDFYFFNKYDLTVHKPDRPDILNSTFYNNKHYNYTHKEAYNMLHGRAVYVKKRNKEGQEYYTWDMLDLSERDKYGNHPILSYGEGRGFKMEDELKKMPIKGVNDPADAGELYSALQRGNRQFARMEIDGAVIGIYLEVNPKKRRVEIYDRACTFIGHSLEYANKQKIEELPRAGLELTIERNGVREGVRENERKSRKNSVRRSQNYRN